MWSTVRLPKIATLIVWLFLWCRDEDTAKTPGNYQVHAMSPWLCRKRQALDLTHLAGHKPSQQSRRWAAQNIIYKEGGNLKKEKGAPPGEEKNKKCCKLNSNVLRAPEPIKKYNWYQQWWSYEFDAVYKDIMIRTWKVIEMVFYAVTCTVKFSFNWQFLWSTRSSSIR